MASLEALDELYAMGFLLEEEYLARRAALGGAPPAPNEEPKPDPVPPSYEPTTDPYATPTTTNDPYPTYIEPIAVPVNHYDPVFELPGDPSSVEPVFNPEPAIEHTVAPTTSHTHERHIEPSAPRDLIQTEQPYPTPKIEVEIQSFAGLHITPAFDSNSFGPSNWIVGPTEALIVHRTEGRYLQVRLPAPCSLREVFSAFQMSGEVYEAGKSVLKTEREMYWINKTWNLPEPSRECLPGRVYVFKLLKTFFEGSVIDQRVLIRYMWSTLEKHPIGNGHPSDYFEGDTRVPNIRMFDSSCCTFDPRTYLNFIASIRKPATRTVPGPSRHRKVRTKETPKFMLWPAFFSTLRALEAKVVADFLYTLPTDGIRIWARLNKCLSEKICYFTGVAAVPNSFLSPELHSEEIMELFRQIQEQSLYPQTSSTEPFDNWNAIHGVGTNTEIDFAQRERICYDSGAKPRSYGWPTQEDLNNTQLNIPGPRPVRVARESEIAMLVAQLASLNGPVASI